MTKHIARHRTPSRTHSVRLPAYLGMARGILQDIGALAGILSALGILPFGQ